MIHVKGHSPCDICLDEKCDGKRNGNCETCENLAACPKALTPIIRVTTKCTQSCSHCCFSCSPKRDEHMSIETAGNVAQFMASNGIVAATIMGGEICCNPMRREILPILLEGLVYCRIVTNGDWTVTDVGFLSILEPYRDIVKISISQDRWHTNKNVEAAVRACEEAGFHYNVPLAEEVTDRTIVPVGRGEFYSDFYSMMGCYCQNPAKKYSFLIDEAGEIHKCNFGIWAYDNVKNFPDGNFAPRFKDFNTTFYSCFITSCTSCLRQYNWSNARRGKN